jgi:Family of unknown function (DUF6101)
MVLGGAMPVGSSRSSRLDPLALPIRFTASDAGADGRLRHVELTHDRVVLRRAVRGIRMAVDLPVTAYLGIALRLVAATADAPGGAVVSLEHRDHGLSVPLSGPADWRDLVAEWRLWGRVLALPLLIADPDGRLKEPCRRLGQLQVGKIAPRRRRRNAVKQRRPSILLRRRSSPMPASTKVHGDEREMIARN